MIASLARLLPVLLIVSGLTSAACGDVESRLDADAGEANADGGLRTDAGSVTDETAFVFDESQIRTFRISLDPDDLAFLDENAQLEQYVPGTVEYEGETVNSIGVRYKGSVGTLQLCFDDEGNRLCDKLSFKLKINEYVDGQKLRGLKRVLLHSMQADASKMHDAIAYKLFRDVGVAAPRTAYANVELNGELLGIFLVVEAIDGGFVKRNFPSDPDGNLYKEVWPEHSTPNRYLDKLKTNEDDNPSVDRIIRFAAAIDATTDATFPAMLESWTQANWMTRFMAVDRLIDNWDGMTMWYCGSGNNCGNHNFYWYESAVSDTLWLIPWDMDNTFREPSPIRTTYGMPDWDITDADCTPIPVFGIGGRPPSCDPFTRGIAVTQWDGYVTESQALIDGAFSAASLDARISELQTLLASDLGADPDINVGQWISAVDRLRTDTATKRGYIQGKINP